MTKKSNGSTKLNSAELARCLIYARALLEYVIIIMWLCYQDVTVREIRGI